MACPFALAQSPQQRHTACEFIDLFLGAADGNAQILQGAFGDAAHLLNELVIGFASLDQIREVHNGQILKIRLIIYMSLIVSVIAMFRIRFAGACTATMHEQKTNDKMITIVVTGTFQKPPKWEIMIFT